jgi:PAS domain S-box-containing protein
MPVTTFYFNPFALISFSSFLIMMVLAFLMWHKYYNDQTKFVVLLFLANAIYSFFYTFEISFKTINEIVWFYRLEYLGIPFLSSFFLIFALHFTGRSRWLKSRNMLLIFGIPIITLMLVFTNAHHHLFYIREEMKMVGPFPSFSFVPAVWYYVQQAYTIVTMLFSLFFLGKMLKNASAIYRNQILFLLLATVFPFIGYLAYQLHLVPFGIDPVSFTFTLTGVFVYIALIRYRLFDLVPIARTKLFEKIQDRVLVFDLNHRMIDYNLSASLQFNLTLSDLGKKIPDLLGRWPEMMHFIQNNLSGKLELHHLEGGISYFYDIQILELDNSNKIKQGKLVVIKDISDLINSERERNYAASKLDAVIQAMPDIMLVINSQGVFTDFFASEAEHLFLNKEEVIGASLKHLFNSEEAEILKGLLADCMKSNQLITHQFEMYFPGDLRHYEARLSRLDETHALAIIRDVSESMHMKQDLIYQSGFQNILINLASRFIYIAELGTDQVINDALKQIGEYTNTNRGYIFHYDAERETMTNTHEWCHDGVTPLIGKRQHLPMNQIPEWLSKHKKGNPAITEKLKRLSPDNPIRKFIDSVDIHSVVTIPMISQKNCLGFVGFDSIQADRKWSDSDISSLKIFTGMLANLQEKITIEKSLVEARIKAEASNQLKTAFMNNISHEIRTPLNGIIGFGEIIANEQLSLDEKNKFLQVVQESSERLIHTIDNYLDISMLVTGNQEIHPKHFIISHLIEEVVNEYADACYYKGLKITAEIPEKLKQTTLYSDPELIHKILNHLAGNAIKFTLKGQISIGLSLESDWLTLFVHDTGIGIADNAQKFIFDSFMQEDFSSTRLYEGSGLGLSIVKGIVKLLGGDVSFTSEKGKGSTFNIILPAN